MFALFRKVLYKLKDIIGLNHRLSFLKSYSQLGEDIIVQSIFRRINQGSFTYLDLGCNHPYRFSNTALFYDKGQSGYCVDANPKIVRRFIKSRVRDKVYNFGLAGFTGSLDFYIMKNSTISTFSKEEFADYQEMGYELDCVIKVPVITLNEFIREYCGGEFPDFFSIDVEGIDLEILKSYNWTGSKPKVICVETSGFENGLSNPLESDIALYLIGKGYNLYAFTSLNSIFVSSDLF